MLRRLCPSGALAMKILPLAACLLAFFLFVVNGSATACKPGEQFDVQFSGTEDTLTGEEAGRFGAWVVDVGKKYPNHSFFMLVANQDEKKPDATLGERRYKWARSFLIQMGENPDRIVYGGTSIWRAKEVGPYSSARPSSLTVEFTPGCPNRCCEANEAKKKGHI